MNGDRIAMSQRERDRLRVMAPVLGKKRTQAEAGRLMGLCARQVRRIHRRLERRGTPASSTDCVAFPRIGAETRTCVGRRSRFTAARCPTST